MKKLILLTLYVSLAIFSNAQSFAQAYNYQLKNPSNTTYNSYTYVSDTINTTHAGSPGSTTYFNIKPTTPANQDAFLGNLSFTLRLTKVSDTLNGYQIWLEGSDDGTTPVTAKVWVPISDTTSDTVTVSSSNLATVVPWHYELNHAGYLHYRIVVKLSRGSSVAALGYAAWKRYYFGQNN